MEICNLMIGDWVEVTRTECVADGGHYITWSEYGKVIGVTDSYIEVEVRDGEYNVDAHEDELKPISLTPKILEQNGFEVFLDFKDLVYYESDDKRIKATNSEGMTNTPNEWSIHIDTKDMRTMAYGEVTYVHEFQHLLRFCGIDKEIEI